MLTQPSQRMLLAASGSLSSQIIVGIAALECAPQPLHLQIQAFCQPWLSTAGMANAYELRLLPLFLLPGVHVMEDIPAEVQRAQAILPANLRITMQPYLGTQGKLQRLIAEQMARLPVEAWILLSHGSRRRGANQTVESLAEAVGAMTAYWSCAPSLEERLTQLRQAGLRRMAIFPYCLFPGGITDAIAHTIATFSQQFPDLHLTLAEPLGANPALVDVLVDLAVRPSLS